MQAFPAKLFGERAGLTQAHARMRCALPNMDGDQLAGAYVYGQIVSNKLWHQLREKARASYSVSPSLTVYRGNVATLQLTTDLDLSSLEDATQALRGVFAPEAASQIDSTSISWALGRLAAESALYNSSTSIMAHQLLWAWNQDWSPTKVLNVGRHAFDVSIDAVKQMESACRNSIVLGFVGNEAQLVDAWNAPLAQ